MIFVVEVLAIYENPGVNPSTQRINNRNSDFTEAQNAANAVGKFPVPPTDEYMARFGRTGDEEPSSRYGFGWRARQWINVRQDADQVGRAIWNRLNSRSLRNGTRCLVFEHRRDEGNQFLTGELLFQQSIPPQSTDVSLA